jgi:hypothetical protein
MAAASSPRGPLTEAEREWRVLCESTDASDIEARGNNPAFSSIPVIRKMDLIREYGPPSHGSFELYMWNARKVAMLKYFAIKSSPREERMRMCEEVFERLDYDEFEVVRVLDDNEMTERLEEWRHHDNPRRGLSNCMSSARARWDMERKRQRQRTTWRSCMRRSRSG